MAFLGADGRTDAPRAARFQGGYLPLNMAGWRFDRAHDLWPTFPSCPEPPLIGRWPQQSGYCKKPASTWSTTERV
jgi:hypothetical protein